MFISVEEEKGVLVVVGSECRLLSVCVFGNKGMRRLRELCVCRRECVRRRECVCAGECVMVALKGLELALYTLGRHVHQPGQTGAPAEHAPPKQFRLAAFNCIVTH